ncbi:MAG: aminodeoxychorismate/anthranilate synthase component II [Bacteroidetes bacterium]|nr:MAG: aminodeoxychorismate/anthranilate synthase component II [Bacteroidota bacterium]
MLLLIDNYDSFSYNLCDYFKQCGAQIQVVRNDELDMTTVLSKYSGIIISPGPGKPKDAGCTMELIERFYDKLPVFGVCLGMQAIGEFFGATLQRASFPMHGKVSEVSYNTNHPLFKGITPPFVACRYHSLILSGIEQTPLVTIAQTKMNEPMALAHNDLPIWAVQFHPEAILTPQGLILINNWLTCFSLKDTKPVLG